MSQSDSGKLTIEHITKDNTIYVSFD